MAPSAANPFARLLVASLIGLGVLWPSIAAHGQATGLQINIVPSGAVVELEGPQHTVTVSPNTIPRPVTGWYRLKANHPGYEGWSHAVYIDGVSPQVIAATLAPKTRAKAGMRALFFPGWGHYYAGRNLRGALFTLTALGLAGGYLYLDNRADDRFSDYESLKRDFDAADDLQTQRALQPQVEEARRRAYNAETDKRNWGWGTLAFYGYQILDAVIFFPEPPRIELGGVEVGLQMPESGTLALGAHYAF
jgi:hypothetical protein